MAVPFAVACRPIVARRGEGVLTRNQAELLRELGALRGEIQADGAALARAVRRPNAVSA